MNFFAKIYRPIIVALRKSEQQYYYIDHTYRFLRELIFDRLFCF